MMLANTEVKTIAIGHSIHLKLEDCKSISLGKYPVSLSKNSHIPMQQSFEFLYEKIKQRIPVYGINTQFGDQVNLLDSHLLADDAKYFQSIENRQINLIRSHCCGLGDEVSSEIVKVAIALRAHCLSQGFSGVSIHTVSNMLDFLNKDIVPIVRRYGSIGASGDLIPLASIATAFLGGNTEVRYRQKKMTAKDAIKQAGLKQINPQLRDGIAMINGTSFMTAIASIVLFDLNHLYKQMLSSIALALESLLVIQSAYHPTVHQLKHHRGEIAVNEFLLKCWSGSKLLTDLDTLRLKKLNKLPDDNIRPLQDCYSLRSIAQGFGPFYENLKHASEWIENEINSVNDNPIIDVANQKIHHGANFMGYYVTDACDLLKMNIAQASTWIHALLANMVHPRKNHGLPTSLILYPEKFNGFRPLQLLAASLAVQNRKLAQSHQAYQLPTEGDNQDVNSLGTHAAFDLEAAVRNLEKLNAILLIASIQAIEFRGVEKASHKAQSIAKKIRLIFPEIVECRPLTFELDALVQHLKKVDL